MFTLATVSQVESKESKGINPYPQPKPRPYPKSLQASGLCQTRSRSCSPLQKLLTILSLEHRRRVTDIDPLCRGHFHIGETKYLQFQHQSHYCMRMLYILGTRMSLLWSMKSSRILPGLSWISTSLQYTQECVGFNAV